MSRKGYQVIEPVIIEDWLGSATHESFITAVLVWLIDRLNSSQDEKFKDVEISVIPVKYVGEYLAIGVHYKYQRDDEDVSGYIEEKIKEYLEATSAFEFLSFCFKQEKSWFDVRQEYSIEARSKKREIQEGE